MECWAHFKRNWSLLLWSFTELCLSLFELIPINLSTLLNIILSNAFFSDFQIQIQMRFNLTRPLRDFLSPSVAPKGLWVSKNVMLSMARWYLGLEFCFYFNQIIPFRLVFYINHIFFFKICFIYTEKWTHFNRK